MPQNQGFAPQDQGFAPQDQGFGGPAPAAQGGSKGPLIGIIIGVVALIAVVVVILALKGGGGADGKYTLYKIKMDGQEYTVQELSDMYGMDVSSLFQFEIEIKGNKCYADLYGEKYEGSAKVSGNTITLTVDGDALDCPYDKSEGTITMEMDGEAVVLKKQ
jgi:hypothetical protein